MNCPNCYKHSGYRSVWRDDRSGRFQVIEFDEENIKKHSLGENELVLVKWLDGESFSPETDWEAVFNQLLERTSGTSGLNEQAALRLADHAQRIMQFEPLLDHLIEAQKIEEESPIPFRGMDASIGRKSGKIVYEFRLLQPKGNWVQSGHDPFPKGTQVVFVRGSNHRWNNAMPLAWGEGYDPAATDERLSAVYSGRSHSGKGICLQIAFPISVDRGSIPVDGYILASQPPPSEKTQLSHLREWCGLNNRMNPVFQSIVFGEPNVPSPELAPLHNASIGKTKSQLDAVTMGCSELPLTLIKGPPGTGKTTVIVEIIQQLAQQGRKVLVCSQTHQAVRNVLERLDSEKRIRMSRYSASDDNLSELELKYLAGSVDDGIEKTTIDRARGSLELARERWEVEGAPLRAFEDALAAAKELQNTRQETDVQHEKVDAEAYRNLETMKNRAEREKESYSNDHAAVVAKLEDRRNTYLREKEWAVQFAEVTAKQASRLHVDVEGESGSADPVPTDIDASEQLLSRRYREIFIELGLRKTRRETVSGLADTLAAELAAIDKIRASREEPVRSKAVAETQSAEQEATARSSKVGEAAKTQRTEAEKQHRRGTDELDSHYGDLKGENRHNIKQKQKELARNSRALASTEKKLEKTRDKLEAVKERESGKNKRQKPKWVPRFISMMVADAEALAARCSGLNQRLVQLLEEIRKCNQEINRLEDERKAMDLEKQQKRAVVDEARAQALAKADREEREGLKIVEDETGGEILRIDAERNESLRIILKEWENSRAEKPERLESCREEVAVELETIDLLQIGIGRIEPRLKNKAKAAEACAHYQPQDYEILPDLQCSPKGRVARAKIYYARQGQLRAQSAACDARVDEVARSAEENDVRLREQIETVELRLRGEFHAEDAQRTERHSSIDRNLAATTARCRKRQAKALVYADDEALTNDEPPESWDRLAEPLRPVGNRMKEEYEFLMQWVHDLETNPGTVRKLHWDNIDVFLSTCVGVASWRQLTEQGRAAVDTVIIDEAAHATLPETIVPMLYGKRCILIGDEMQLPPICMENGLPPVENDHWIDPSEVQESMDRKDDSEGFNLSMPMADNWMERSFFEWLYRYRPGLSRVMLDKQFRMHPSIANFVARVFYPEGLNNGVSCEQRQFSFAEFGEAVCVVQTDGDPNRFEEQDRKNNGCQNQREAGFVVDILEKAQASLDLDAYRESLVAEIDAVARQNHADLFSPKHKAKRAQAQKAKPSFGIITPYALQKEFIRGKLKSRLPMFNRLDMALDDVGSVDSYQGSERDVIIVSFVRSPKTDKANLQFVRDLRRLNVAFSRAKRMLILVGDFGALTNPRYKGNHEGGRVLDEMRSYVAEHGQSIVKFEVRHGR